MAFDENTNSEADRKKKLQDFVQKSKARRDALNKDLASKAAERQLHSAEQSQWAQQQIAAEAKREAQKKANFVEWQKQQKEQKAAIAQMLKEQAEEKERLKQKADEAKEAARKKKKYMDSLRWNTAISMAKDKRDKIAKEAKDFALQDAEHDLRRDTELAEQNKKTSDKDITEDAKKRRGMLDGQLEQTLELIESETKDAYNILFKKEMTEKQSLLSALERKKYAAKQQPNPMMQRQMLQNVDREEKQLLKHHIDKYNKAKQEIEVQRNTRIATAQKQMKKTHEAISMDERQILERNKSQLHQQKMALQQKFAKERQLAYEKEQEILHLTLEEAVGLKKEEENLDQD